MSIDFLEAVDTVSQINEIFEVQFPVDETLPFDLGLSLTTDGYAIGVDFLGNQIWNSDNDERDYFEENDKYEPLKSYLLYKINEMLGWLKTFDPYFGQEKVEDGQEC